MRSNKWPIIIDGKRYFVELTFSGEPAIYKAMGDGIFKHISGRENQNIKATLSVLEPGEVVIIARKS